MNFIIIHGTGGSPEVNWFPWLKKELESRGHRVFIPRFPTPEGQSLESWMKALDEYDKYFDENLILIGHSIGVAFILHKLEKIEKPIRAAFLVAGFTRRLGDGSNPDIEFYDNLNSSFYGDHNYEKIKKNCRDFFVYAGDNDPYVPLDRSKEIADKLGVKLKIIHGGGHLNSEFGYTKFPQLLEDIISFLSRF